jgi:exopolysaccharide biosynthesis WecB/TagA/CpsF family protein
MTETATISSWPERHPLLRLRVSATTYDEAEDLLIAAARERRKALVAHLSVHGLVHANRDAEFAEAIEGFDIVAPDGQPVRWALNQLWGTGLTDRVYGPELMKRLCRRAAREGISIYLYGSSDAVIERLRETLLERFPRLVIAGSESPPFRDLTPEEQRESIARINESGAALVFIGLGCPKQELFAFRNRDRIEGVQLCVGAAFDFLSGQKKMAPRWMQKRGLEWLFRLGSEPRRLAGRYVPNNTLFLIHIGRELVRFRAGSGRSREERDGTGTEVI